MSYDITVGSSGISVNVQVVDDYGIPVQGLDADTFPATKYSFTGPYSDIALGTLVDLAEITSDHVPFGVKERSGGYYRLDLPDSIAGSIRHVTLYSEQTNRRLLCSDINIVPNGIRDIVLPITTSVVKRGLITKSPDLAAYVGSGVAYSWRVIDENKNPVDLTGRDLRFIIRNVNSFNGNYEFSTSNGVAIGGDNGNYVTFTKNNSITETAGQYEWVIRDATDPDDVSVIAFGDWIVYDLPSVAIE